MYTRLFGKGEEINLYKQEHLRNKQLLLTQYTLHVDCTLFKQQYEKYLSICKHAVKNHDCTGIREYRINTSWL